MTEHSLHCQAHADVNVPLASTEESVPCNGCGYDIAGLPSDAPCPECTHPVVESRVLLAGGIPTGRAKGIATALRRSGYSAFSILIALLFDSTITNIITSSFPALRIWWDILWLVIFIGSVFVLYDSIRRLRATLSPISAFTPLRTAAAFAEYSALALAIFTSIFFTGIVGKNLPYPTIARGVGTAMGMAEYPIRVALVVIIFVHLRSIFPVMQFLVTRIGDTDMLKKLKNVTEFVPVIIFMSTADFIIQYTPLKSIPGIGLLGLSYLGLLFVWFRYAGLLTALAKTYAEKRDAAAILAVVASVRPATPSN